MKVAVTSKGNSLDSEISPVFGKCPYFIIVDIKNGEIKVNSTTENPAKNLRGAGNKAAEFIIKNEINTLISESIGPNAFDILRNARIRIYKFQSGSVKDNLKLFSEGKLVEITSSSALVPDTGNPGKR